MFVMVELSYKDRILSFELTKQRRERERERQTDRQTDRQRSWVSDLKGR